MGSDNKEFQKKEISKDGKGFKFTVQMVIIWFEGKGV